MKYVIFFLCAMLLAAPSLFSQTAFGDGSPQSIDDGGYIGLNTTNCWYFSGSNIYTLGANVGIGIIPSQRLTVYEAGTETQLMIRADNDQSSGLYLGSTANDLSGYFVTTHSTGRMDFGGTAGNTMVLDNPNKRVGIGTTSPDSKLTIKSGISGAATIVNIQADDAGSALKIYKDSSDNGYMDIFDTNESVINRITSSGSSWLSRGTSNKIGIGTSTIIAKETLQGDFFMSGETVADSTGTFYISYNVQTTSASTVSAHLFPTSPGYAYFLNIQFCGVQDDGTDAFMFERYAVYRYPSGGSLTEDYDGAIHAIVNGGSTAFQASGDNIDFRIAGVAGETHNWTVSGTVVVIKQ